MLPLGRNFRFEQVDDELPITLGAIVSIGIELHSSFGVDAKTAVPMAACPAPFY